MKLIILSMAFIYLGPTHARGKQTNTENEAINSYMVRYPVQLALEYLQSTKSTRPECPKHSLSRAGIKSDSWYLDPSKKRAKEALPYILKDSFLWYLEPGDI